MHAILTAVLAAIAVNVDFTKDTGTIKPLNGICNSPMPFTPGANGGVRDLVEVREMGAPFVRLHDTGGPYGRGTLVDVPNVFPDKTADENDPANYDFAFTDAYLGALVKAGAKPYYRLGVTIENFYRIKAYRIYPPKDPAKYARVCEHIVRHYTKGWANGFKWDMPYWEVWCEPENKMLWLGDRHQFFDLYAKIAREIKAHHPEIKIGGYGACRFESFENMDVNSDDCRENWLPWFEEFCEYITNEKTKAPLDFFSWHLYNPDQLRILWHAQDVRTRLDKHGLKATEAHLTEWNHGGRYGLYNLRTALGGVYTLATMCALQRAPVDLAMLYQADPASSWCSVFDPATGPTPVFYALKAFSEIRALGRACQVEDDIERRVFALAATDGKRKILVIANDSLDIPRTVKLKMTGADGVTFDAYRLDAEHPKFERVRRPFDLREIYLPAKGAIMLKAGL